MYLKRILRRYLYLTTSVLMFTAGVVIGGNKAIIMVNNEPFASAEKAAFSEKSVNFWDNDYRDDRACTECFAATELKKFLAKVTDIKEGDIEITGVKGIPKEGDIFILGSSKSNPACKRWESQF